ncbi:MAG: phosphoribosylanthranilate isomerase, partial [Butyricicoccus sp.]
MTKIKLCGLSRPCDIEAANALQPDYIGFVFAPKSRRYVSPETAAGLRKRLDPAIRAVGVFVNERPEAVAALLRAGTIDIAQLHGSEDAAYIERLRALTGQPIVQAFRMESERDIAAAQASTADSVLLDSGAGGTGTAFDWTLLRGIRRPYFL